MSEKNEMGFTLAIALAVISVASSLLCSSMAYDVTRHYFAALLALTLPQVWACGFVVGAAMKRGSASELDSSWQITKYRAIGLTAGHVVVAAACAVLWAVVT